MTPARPHHLSPDGGRRPVDDPSTRPGRVTRARRLAVPALAGVLALVAALPAAAQPAPAGAPTAAARTAVSDDVVVDRVAGGYEVTLDLDEPLEVRSDAPVLTVDGEPLGVAVESADGLSLSVVTPEPVADGADVAVAWSGDVAGAGLRAAVPDRTAVDGPVLDVDPGTPGRYGVRRADYDLGDAVWALDGLPAPVRAEARAAVYLPAGARGERPLVVVQHGRHSYCVGPRPVPDVEPPRYPCAGEQREIPSYLGYDELAENLASHGYAVVSVSTNAVNANDNQLAPDLGAQARGDLVLHHLDLLARATEGRAPELRGRVGAALRGRLDLGRVGLMGHSRGGEGVVEAALMNAARPEPYGIGAVLPLAPVDFARPVLPDVPMAVVLPYCDGDVSNLQGQHFYDDSRYTTDDDVLRSSLLVMGANHNWFNTEWTPGLSRVEHGASDDWRAEDPLCGRTSPERLAPAEQRAVGTAYMAGFFRLVLGGEDAFLPLFDGSGATAASTGRAVVHPQAQAPGSSRLDLDPMDGTRGAPVVTGSGTAQVCSSLAERPVPLAQPACAPAASSSRMPHWTPASRAPSAPATPVTVLSWTAPVGDDEPATLTVALPADRRDVSGRQHLELRLAPAEGLLAPVDLRVTAVDGSGRERSALVSQLGDALMPLPAGVSPLLPKTVLRTVQVPVSLLEGLDTTDLREVRLTAATPSGTVYLSDLTASTPGAGSGGPSDLPQVSVTDAAVAEGDGASTAAVAVRLSRPSTETVRVRVESLAAAGPLAREAREVVLPPGTTCVPFTVPLVGDDLPGTAATTAYNVVAAVPVGAVTGDAFGVLTVHEDDGVVAADGSSTPVDGVPGPQAGVCTAA